VTVRLILDKSNDTVKYSGATFAQNAGIEVLIDDKVAIAHNKVIIVDAVTVVTGSLNFTTAASKRNAENVVVITDKVVAAQFVGNWHVRAPLSRPYRKD
jgi:phosphatidylserine/phosphatidylglycerophosphate/cardiolipin synthase-like enzyme